MRPEPERIKEIFAQALERKTPVEREEFLAEACNDQPGLRPQVESLLRAHEQAGDFLGQTIKLPPATFEPEPAGTMIGRYKLLEKIGEGGFGVVYMAEQQEPVHRKVALKIIKPGMDTREVIARFEAERQALALIDHPNIARVLDGGATAESRPYFVMELVRGIPITEFCDQKNLPTAERLRLFIKVCQAVQHAHQKAVIHRDLKPSNILVTLHDGEAVPKVIDFGVAKALGQELTEKTLFTAFRQMIGTPAYMAPEQAEMSGVDIDTRSDIYSLGVLLYELLTGVTPFDKETLAKAGLDEIRRMIRETEPPKPSTRLRALGDKLPDVAKHRHTEPTALSRLVRGDLDWIVMKCLEKDRTRRYETANGLAREISRFLNNEPVTAAAPSTLYRARKFVHRHKAALAATIAILGLVAMAAVVSTWEAVRATANAAEARRQAARAAKLAEEELKQRQHAELLAEQNQQNLYCADVRLAQQALQDGNWGQARTLLAGHQPRIGERDLRGFEWYYLWNLCRGDSFETFQGHSNIVTAVAFSPNGRTLASGSWDKTVKLWDLRERKCIANLRQGSRVISLSFSTDSRILAIGSEEGVELWNWAEQRVVFKLAEPSAYVAFSPTGAALAVGSRGKRFGGGGLTEVWDYVRNNKVISFPESGARVAFSHDGSALVTGDWNGIIKLWDLATRAPLGSVRDAGEVSVLSFSPDGRTLATVNDWSGKVVLWDIRTGAMKSVLTNHTGRVWGMAFSPDGSILATASSDQTVRLWEVALGQERTRLRGHGSEVWSVAFSPDGKILASGSKDETVLLWRASKQNETQTMGTGFSRPVFTPDGSLLAVKNGQRSVALWKMSSGRRAIVLEGEQRVLDFSPDGTALIVALFSEGPARGGPQKLLGIKSYNLANGTSLPQVSCNPPMEGVSSAKLSPDRTTLAARGADGSIRLWEATTGRLIRTFQGEPGDATELAFSADGRILAWGTPSRTVAFLDWSAGTMLANLAGHKDGIFSVVFCPHAPLLASASIDGTVRLWNTVNFTEAATLSGHKEGVVDVAFSPDGRTVASASGDHTVKLWNVATRRELAIFKHEHPVRYVTFSPDTQSLITVTDDDTLLLWRIANPGLDQTDTGLVSLWRAEGNANDSFGSNGGIIHGSVGFLEGKLGQAFSFDGTATGYIEVPDSPTLDLLSQATLMAWVSLDELPSQAQRNMQIAAKSQPNNDLDLQVERDDRVRFWIGPGIAVSSTTTLRTGVWYHITATYAAKDCSELFINGMREGFQRIAVARSANINPLFFGGNTVWPNRALHGKLDEVRVFDRALSGDAIKSVYAAEAALSR